MGERRLERLKQEKEEDKKSMWKINYRKPKKNKQISSKKKRSQEINRRFERRSRRINTKLMRHKENSWKKNGLDVIKQTRESWSFYVDPEKATQTKFKTLKSLFTEYCKKNWFVQNGVTQNISGEIQLEPPPPPCFDPTSTSTEEPKNKIQKNGQWLLNSMTRIISASFFLLYKWSFHWK